MIKFIRFFNRFTTVVTLTVILVSAVFVVPGLAGIRQIGSRCFGDSGT